MITAPEGFKNVPTDLNLITFRKGQDNFFSSSVTSMNNTNLTFPKLQEALVRTINQTYSNLKNTQYKLQTSETTIGDISFNKIQIQVYDKTTGELIIKQDIYNSLVDNKIFSASINYNSEKEKEVMEEVFFKSVKSKKRWVTIYKNNA
ncbi:hypothetical protein [Pontibacter actiniarum]|nr:hypothetical protein [Pontibacter actiniarum]